MTALGEIGADGYPGRAVVEWHYPAPCLIDLATLAIIVTFEHDQDPRDAWQLRGDAAIHMKQALERCRCRLQSSMRFGHTSVTAARILLHSRGICTGCDFGTDLAAEDARDVVHIRTVDPPAREAPEVLIQEAMGCAPSYIDGPYPPKSSWLPQLPPDWPGVLCQRCLTLMQDRGFNSLLDFRFSHHPKCPRCGAERTQRAKFGMPASEDAYRNAPPWIDWRGCCRTDDIWTCTACGHT
jgi:hypothetical protein